MTITGVTTSRLSELEKYTVSSVFEEKYKMGGSSTINGVVSGSISSGEVVYYINGIKYTDIYSNETVQTLFEYIPIELDTQKRYTIKNEKYGKSVDKPTIKSDVFVRRGEFSPFKDNHIISDLENLTEIEMFAGGNYFNIIKNS